ncbi:hypothetical protein P168DRAFT_293741 [Aspergillus campestris IBT 28561]|uniref:Uncharacterized protein n=1 Tax=Aspergillus campestris (strain IBT 28561) TaxID=1392248 RepID=A0A2I1CRB1_ASPC2|nr:uncharacterized protein P168DRAFT_293741 [Aspergillus campestris IBT 28561]PKY00163.1 hypothetical protein P168DRAFT_293741 [Aspergillus campestris IBT 28561]
MSTWQDLFDTDPQGTRAFIDPRATDLNIIYDTTMTPTNMFETRPHAPAHRPTSQWHSDIETYLQTSTESDGEIRPSARSLTRLRRFDSPPRPYVSLRPHHWRRLQVALLSVQLPHNPQTHPAPPLRPAPHLEAVIDRAWADPTLVAGIEKAAGKHGADVVSVIFEVTGVSYPSGTEFGGSSGSGGDGGGRSEGESDSVAEADDKASCGDWGDSVGHAGFRFSQRRRVPVARVMLGSHVSSLGRLILQLRIGSLLKRRRLNEWGFDVSINTPTQFKWGKIDEEKRWW